MTTEADDPRNHLEMAIKRSGDFIDWWFTPRWRALLMWTLVPGAIFYASMAGELDFIDNGSVIRMRWAITIASRGW
jgi:hypothetical protein